jgi:hypothetical protein
MSPDMQLIVLGEFLSQIFVKKCGFETSDAKMEEVVCMGAWGALRRRMKGLHTAWLNP